MTRKFDYASVAPLYNDLIQRGFAPQHAAAIAGNFAYESGPKGRIDYGVQELKPTAGRGGYGAAQWTGPRRVGLEQFAKQNQLPLHERETQMKYFDKERTGPERAAFDRLQKTGDVNSATKSFMQNYERPRASTANLAARQQLAQEIYNRGQRGDFNQPGQQPTQLAKNDAPLPPQRPDGLGQQPQLAKNDIPPGSVLNRINPKDPSGPLLPEPGQTQMADVGKNDFGRGIPASGAQTPPMNGQLEAPQTLMADAPLPPSRPEGLGQQPTLMADAPLPPTRPGSFAAPAPVQIAHGASGGMNNMLSEPMSAPTGGIEGFASGGSPAQLSPGMMNPQMIAQQQGDFGGLDLGNIFADAFQPADMQQTQFADAGTDFGGGFGDFGAGLGGLFA